MDQNEFKPIWGKDDEISIDHFQWHNSNPYPIMLQDNSPEDEEENNLDSFSNRKQSRMLSLEQITELHQKKKNLMMFISNIGELSNELIRKDILLHCEKVPPGLYSNISSDQVIKLTKNRVEKMIKNKRIKKNWSEEDIKILIWIVSKYCQIQGNDYSKDSIEQNDWEFIANLIPGVTPKSCMFKWLSLKKNNLAQNSWIEEESNLLNELVKIYGIEKWGLISELLYEKNKLPQKIFRCPKQCRQHWNCYLDPKLKKGPWEKHEDILLLKSVQILDGAKRWAQIVKLFNGRTENALKNRFNLIIDKQNRENKGKKKISQGQIIENYLKKHQNSVKIQEGKLQLLKSKKNIINQTKNNQRAQRTCKKVLRRRRKQGSDSEQYDPSEYIQVREQPIVINHTPKIKHQVEEEHQNFQIDIQRPGDVSYNNLFKNPKIQQPIFEEEQEQHHHHHHRHHHQLSESVISQGNFQIPQRKNSANIEVNHDDQGTNEEHLNIDMASVHVVSLDTLSFERLKSQFSQQRHNFVPAKVTSNNQIVKYRINRQKQ